MTSITRRIYISFFLFSLTTISIMIATVEIVSESLEQTMLHQEFDTQKTFIVSQINPQQPLWWQSPGWIAVYLPSGRPPSKPLPDVFKNLSENTVQEIKFGAQDFLVSIGSTENGRLYLARDISLFEKKEALFGGVLLVVGFILLVSAFLLSRWTGRHLTYPLRTLSQQIGKTQASDKMARIQNTFRESELHVIAETFNHFLDSIEAFFKRESNLLNLASHELRTPVSVVLGALEVLEESGELSARDRKVLSRIKQATNEMKANIQALLMLSRYNQAQSETVEFDQQLENVLEQLNELYATEKRIQTEIQGNQPHRVNSDPVLVKMLIRNLVENALQHTRHQVFIRLTQGTLEISDQGDQSNEPLLARLAGEQNIQDGFGGLGLYIVTLICEKLDWKLSAYDREGGGTTIRIRFSNPEALT